MEIFMALTMGLLGSFHCVGMCGPIAVALPLSNGSFIYKSAGRLMYNAGRIITYSTIGLVFGLAGKVLAMAGLQQIISIVLGSIILISVIFSYSILNRLDPTSFIYKAVAKLKQRLSKLIHKKSFHSLFSLGLLNGLLPCGLVYMALTAALATGDAFKGASFMFFFGLGTMPLMFAVSMIGNILSLSTINKVRKSIPVMMVLLGALLIIRGLNIGIPMMSPKVNHETATLHKCH
jgi:sulfite exporter TauE/SafE